MKPVGRKRGIRAVLITLSCTGLIILGVVLLGFASGNRSEPQFKGKSLSEWLAIYMRYGRRDAQGEEAYAAVKEIGTNALPILVADLHWKPPAWNRMVIGAVSPWPSASRRVQRFFWESDRRLRAHLGIFILGADAAPAVPELVRSLVDPEASEPQIFALGAIGQPAWAQLMVTLTTRTNSMGVRIAAIYALGEMGTNASDSINVLIDCLRETPGIDAWAAWALVRVAVDPETVIPALTNALQSPTVALRRAAANSLYELGGGAESAAPALRAVLRDVDEDVRKSATNALAEMKLGDGR